MLRERTTTVLGVVFVLAVLAAFVTIAFTYRLSQAIDRERVALVALEREIAAVEVALSDFKAAQYAYFAPESQPHDVWLRRGTELMARLETMLTARREATANGAARARYDAALGALAGLSDGDSRARSELANAQSGAAADLVFNDGVETVQRVRAELSAAQTAEATASAERITTLQHSSLGITGGAFAFVVVLLLLVSRTPRLDAPSPASLTAQMIRDLPPPVKAPAPPAPTTAAKASPVLPVPAPAISLPEAAELCVDLARVIDGRDVPALIERAAGLLDAKGVILWSPDGAGEALRPSLTHGYSPKVVSRLGTLEVAADNVTSLCFRSMRAQVMPGSGPDSSGAIAVPIITPGGCAGVLSAEVRDARPSPELIALTRIIAAQFAALVGPGGGETRTAVQA